MSAIWQSRAEIQNFGKSALGNEVLRVEASWKIAVKNAESRKGQMNAASDRDIES